MAGKRIVILGGGVGGIAVANALWEQLGEQHRVIVVDRQATKKLFEIVIHLPGLHARGRKNRW